MASSSSGSSAFRAGGTHDREQEPVVDSWDQITVERQWNRLIIRGPQPHPRSKHAAVVVDGKMFVFGGESPEGQQNDLQIFHGEKLTWESVDCGSPPPNVIQHDTRCPSCIGHSPVHWQKDFVLVGCQSKSKSENKVVTVASSFAAPQSWCTLSTKGNVPVARCGHTVVRMAYRLVLFGGEDMNGRLLNDIHILDLISLLWLPVQTSGTKPSPRKGHFAASYSERYLWIFGGKTKSKNYRHDTYCLDFQTMMWTKAKTKGPRPMARAGHSGIIVGNKWYFIGGECRANELRKMVAFNLDTHEWSEVISLQPGSPLSKEGISLVRIIIKGRTFGVAFGGHNTKLSNQIYVMLLPSRSELDSPQLSPQSSSISSAHSTEVSRRTSIASSGDVESPGSMFSILGEILNPDRETDAFEHGEVYEPRYQLDDQEDNVPRSPDRVLDCQDPSDNQDPSSNAAANDDEAPYQIPEVIHDELRRLAEGIESVRLGERLPSRLNLGDLDLEGSDDIKPTSSEIKVSPQNGTHEPAVNVDLSEKLLTAWKANEDLHKKLRQSQSAQNDLENIINEIRTQKDGLEQQYFDLLHSKADEQWKYEESQRKLEEMERRLSSSSQPREDADAGFKSASNDRGSLARKSSLASKFTEEPGFRKDTSARPSSPNTKLFEDSAFSMESDTSNETERRLEVRRLEEAEIKLAALLNAYHVAESKLITATREKRELSESVAIATQRMEEARSDCKALRTQNLRLGHDLLAVRDLLEDTKEELQSKIVELAQATARNIELQVEMHELSQKFSGSSGASL